MAAFSVTVKPLSITGSHLLSLHSSLFIPSIPHSRIPTQPIKARVFSTTKKTHPSLSPVVSVAPSSSWELEKRVSDWEDAGEDTGFELGTGGYGDSGEGGFFVREERLGSEEAKIFVGNLPNTVDSENLAMLFEKAGAVEIAEVIYNRDTNESRGFGFVTMEKVEAAQKAMDMFHQYDLEGRILTVNKANSRQSREVRTPRAVEPGFRLYVGNLPWDVDNARLEQVFSEHGDVVNARVVFDRETGRSRGFGFVTLTSKTDMNNAIDALDGQSLDGRAIRVNVAEEKPRRGFF